MPRLFRRLFNCDSPIAQLQRARTISICLVHIYERGKNLCVKKIIVITHQFFDTYRASRGARRRTGRVNAIQNIYAK